MRDYKAIAWNKTFGIKQLLADVSFLIREGEHIGLIGTNGSGKSTLLEIISGKDTFDSGEVEMPRDFSIGYVPQEADLDPNQTIFEAIYESDSPLVKLVGEYEQAILDLNLNPESEAAIKRYQDLETDMNQRDGWTLDTKIRTILSKLGITDVMQPIHELSGGQRKRINLAKVLIDDPDLLLMDEPTNHLDFDMVEWLQNYIKNYKKSVLAVTHDRYFLDQIADRILALNRGDMREYEGNYQAYLEKRAHEEEIAAATQEKQKKLYKSELAWMRKGAKARTTKQQARINRFEDLKADVNQPKAKNNNVTLDFEQQRLGKKVITLDHVSVGYDNNTLVKDINLIIQNDERMGIIGDNGAGKTTLLNTMAGLLPSKAGTVELGETVRIAYFRQIPADLPEDKRMISFIQEVAQEYEYTDGRKMSASQMLEQFLFPRETHGMLIEQLSGGEKKRLYLLKLLMERPNVLFLDEPTNDLDIDTLTVLEDYLETFPGAVITVSHDRYFLNKVVDKLLILTKSKQEARLFYGNYSHYREAIDNKPSEHSNKTNHKTNNKESVTQSKPKDENKTNDKKRMTYAEKKDWETIEDEIDQLEMAIAEIDNEMSENGNDFSKLSELQKEKESKENDLLQKIEYWEYLSELSL